MSKGRAITDTVARPGQVSYETAPQWPDIYEVSTVKNPKYDIGDNYIMPNGKGFVYCKSGGACYAGQGNAVYNAIPATGIDYANNVAAAAAIGDTEVVITNGATIAQTLDGLKNGTILFKTLTDSNNTALQCRGIIGNTAGGTEEDITIYLDGPLTGALTTSSYSYCMPSPYSDVRLAAGSGNRAMIGPAAVYVDAADKYFWCQFKGRVMGLPLSGNGGASVVGSQNFTRNVVWRSDGSLQVALYDSGQNGRHGQVAGYVVDNNDALNGGTEFMLTGNV